MQRERESLRRKTVCRHRQRDGGRLQGQADILKIILEKQVHVALGTLHQGLRAGMPVFFKQAFLQRAGVDPDADRNMTLPAGVRNRLDVLRTSYVAGVDADLVDAALGAHQGQAVVKVDIGHQGYVHLLLDFVDRQGGLLVGNRKAHNIRAGRAHGTDLRYGGFNIPGLCIAHRLYGNRCIAADA